MDNVRKEKKSLPFLSKTHIYKNINAVGQLFYGAAYGKK